MKKKLTLLTTLFMSMLFGVSAFAADIDVTSKVGTSREAWNAPGGPVAIDGVQMPEKYETTTATLGDVMWQTVEGLDNGTYTVELWANARYTAGRGFESAATDGQLECTFLYANNVEISIPVVFNASLNNNTSHVLEGVEVTDGTLKIGMTKKADGSNWHTIQIKSLIYHTSDDAALAAAKADLKAALDAAAAAVPATEALTAAIATAQAIYDGSDLEAIKAAVAPLKAATALAVNTNAVAGATVAAPVVTNFVVNGTFDTTTAPWKTTTNAQNKALASNQTGAFTGNFFENWNPSSYTGKIYQVIENIPNGLYELSICAFVSNFDASAQYVYANADKKALVAGEPTAYTVRTTVTDNRIEVGFEQIVAVANWIGIDNVSLKFFGEVDENYAKDMYASTKAAAEALLGEKMSAEAKASLEAALAAEVDETSDEALIAAEAALQEVMATVKASVNFFASNKAAIDAMFSLMENTNVYTVEAYEAYKAKAEDFLAQYEAGTLTATVDNPAGIHGWRASVDYDDLLLSAFGTNNFDSNLYINTWSTEGEGDGSEFKVPFYEYWVGDGQSLGAATKTATVTGLEAGKVYELSAWVRTRAKNGVAAAEATGITLNVGDGDTVDVTEGAVVDGTQFAHAVYTAIGTADENGSLTINFNVLADNNVSWLSFKNLKYTEYNPAKDEFLAAYAQLELLTESCPSLWMITACNEKFMAIQEPAYAMKEAINATPIDTLVKYTAVLNETVAFIQAMDGKYNAWKDQLFVAYDYQDNSTADSVAVAAFAEVVEKHMGYQWMMPATSVAELEALIAELKDASIAYACVAVANEGFDFGLPTVDSPWAGAAVSDSLYAYVYNASAKAFLGAGNSWGTQASFNDGIEWIVSGADNLYTLDGPISNGGASHFFTGTYTDGAATQVTVKAVGKNLYTLQVGGMYVAYDGTNIVANIAELSEACYWQFVTKAERQSKYATASVANPVDATFEISGADFGRNDGRNSVWTGSPVVGGDNANCCGEKWNAGIATVSQVLRGMPNGVYRMSAQGFYRMGNMDPAAEARTNGTEVLHAKFFANGDSIDVMSVLDCAGMLEGVGNAGYTGFGLAPNSMGEASKFFSEGLYEHSFMFTLEEGVDTIALGVTKTGSVAADWLIFDNFRLEYLGALNESDYFGNGMLTSVAEGNHYVFYTDAEGKNHFLHAAGVNNWAVGDYPTTIAFSVGNITDGFAGAASFMNSNGFYMSNAANADGSGAIKTEEVDGKNGQSKRTWESQVFYKNAAGKYAIRLTNATGTSWGANCFVNIDPATLAVVSGQPSLADALYLWEIADEDDPRFSTQVLDGLIEEAEAIDGKFHRDIKMMLDSVIYLARFATAAEVQAVKVQLEEAIAAAKASVAEYEAIARQLASCASVMVEAAEGYKEFAAVVTSVETAYNNATATAELIPVLVEAISAYLAANEVEGIIVNGDFTNGTAGWTGSMNIGSHNKWTNVNDGFVERWIGNTGLPDFDFYQEISGLPAGTYTFAAYVVACRQSEPDDYEVTGVDLYANGESVAVHTINVDRNEANMAIGAELVLVTATIAEGETLTVGMRAMGTDANWVVIDNAKLYNFEAKVDIDPGTPDYSAILGAYTGDINLTHLQGEGSVLEAQTISIAENENGGIDVVFPSFMTMIGMETGEILVQDVTVAEGADGSYSLAKEQFTISSGYVTFPYSTFSATVYSDGAVEAIVEVVQNPEMGALTTAEFFTSGVDNPIEMHKFPIVIGRSETALKGYKLLEGATTNESDVVTYTSQLYTFSFPLTRVRFTVKETGANGLNGDYPFFALSSFEMFDAEGNEIDLTSADITSNACHNTLNPDAFDGAGIDGLVDDDPITYFHSTWRVAVNEHHYIEVTLPEGEYSAFSFVMTARWNQPHQFPAVLEITHLSDDAVDNFIAAYESLELLTETCSSLSMIPASNEKFFEVYEPAYAIREAIDTTPTDVLVEYTAILNETVAYILAMDAKYNEWREVLWACYDCQDNYTASPEATEAFAVMVDMHSSYQWSMPATTPAEIDGMIAELLAAMDAFLTDAPVSPKMGDVNSDGQHTMSDVVMMVNAVLNIAQNNFNAAVADINGDGQLTIVDVVSVVRFVLGYEPVAAARDMHREASMVAIEAGSLMAGNHGEILLPIYMASDADYTAFQLDVVLPEGLTLADATLGGRGKISHTLSWSTLDNGATRIVAFAMDNAAFKDNAEALAILTLKAEGALQKGAVINLTDGLFATASGAEDRAADVALKVEDETTGVGTLLGGIRVSGAEGAVVVESAADAVLSIYTMTGQLVQQAEVKAGESRIALPAGVYVVNNQKVIVK